MTSKNYIDINLINKNNSNTVRDIIINKNNYNIPDDIKIFEDIYIEDSGIPDKSDMCRYITECDHSIQVIKKGHSLLYNSNYDTDLTITNLIYLPHNCDLGVYNDIYSNDTANNEIECNFCSEKIKKHICSTCLSQGLVGKVYKYIHFKLSSGSEYLEHLYISHTLYNEMKNNPTKIIYLKGHQDDKKLLKYCIHFRNKIEYAKIYPLCNKFRLNPVDKIPIENEEFIPGKNGSSIETSYPINYMMGGEAKVYVKNNFLIIDDTGEYGPYTIPLKFIDELIKHKHTIFKASIIYDDVDNKYEWNSKE